MARQEAELGRHLPLGLAKIRPDTMWADKPPAETTRTMDSSTGFLVWDPLCRLLSPDSLNIP